MVIFVVWIIFIILEQKTNLNCVKKVRENKNFCNVIMPSDYTKILEFNQYKKSDKVQFIIHVDFQCLTEKIYGCKNNPKNSSTFIHQVLQCLQNHYLKA